ncbi:MAG: bifunctional [glutamine synthetase] adenylyltransferase/[glutamine synthetase]-adenylyl-L-tyrosine phosphorylase [Dongiaceae bacterium]
MSIPRPLLSALPNASDQMRAMAGLERWRDLARESEDPALAAAMQAMTGSDRAILSAVFGNSPFLSHCLLAEPAVLPAFVAQGADSVFRQLLDTFGPQSGSGNDTNRLMQALRYGRRRAALIIALADLTGAWSLERVTAALSEFADRAVGAAASHLLRRALDTGQLELADPDDTTRDSGLVIIGMGKLGARELNYSSDIDLIILYDPDKVRYRGSRSVQDFFVRLARDLVRILQEHTEAGYVFRTDLRLRPDPASTPLALSVIAAETYYEGMGQNWERAAMIKARTIAGDLAAGEQFLRNLRPFLWRKHLDFAAIQDIHSIKRQIHAVKGHREIAVAGHNIKLGRGGIREIEFFAQTQQLIWGGRNPDLRRTATCEAIRALVDAGRVTAAVAADMIAAYRFLRHVEHRLQMVDDQQTQTLPTAGPELDAIACFAGFATTGEFAAELLRHLGNVEDHYADLFEEAPSLGGPGSLVFTGTENDPDTVRTLERMGFGDGGSISNVIRGWHHGRYRAMRSTRARELLTEIMPRLLETLAKTAQPDAAFARFDEFLGRLPAGVQLFSLLYANPGLLDLIAEIMGGAPRLAEHLSRNAVLLEAVLSRGFFDPPPPPEVLREELAAALRYASDFQDVLDAIRRWTKDRQFQVGVRVLRNVTDAASAGQPLADIADSAIAVLQPHVERDFARVHGQPPGAGIATVALGKLGSREITLNSDLDLIFIYDTPTDEMSEETWNNQLSNGLKPLAPIHYFARLAQRLINAVTAQTGEGRLFDVDMRLRPSGNSGPIASSLDGFRRYQLDNAWTWEHMALARARVIAGEPDFARRIEAVLREILTRPRDPAKLVAEVADMRRRIDQQHPGESFWDLKYRRGGLVDVEFIAQYLQLRHAERHPEVLSPGVADSLDRMIGAGILPAAVGNDLREAVKLWHRLFGMLRLTIGQQFDEATLPAGISRTLAKTGGVGDFAALKALVEATATRVTDHFQNLIEGPARDLPRPEVAADAGMVEL